MTQQPPSPTPHWQSDIFVLVGVLVCLGLGASLTYWMTHDAGRTAAEDAAPVARGGLLDAANDPNAGLAQVSATNISVPELPPPSNTDEFPFVAFDTLTSYYYEVPDFLATPVEKEKFTKKDQIPAPIRAMNKRRVQIQGFMMPVKIEKGQVSSFMLMKDRSMCCFQRFPRMNEWVSVRMVEGKTSKYINDQPITVFGTLEVGEDIKDGEVLNIYRMEAEDVAGPLDL